MTHTHKNTKKKKKRGSSEKPTLLEHLCIYDDKFSKQII